MSRRLEHFRFDVYPDGPSFAYTDPASSFAYGPSYQISVSYGAKRYGFSQYMPPDEIGISESYLEYFIRQAVTAFREAINADEDKQAKAELDRKQKEFVKAADDYRSRAVKR